MFTVELELRLGTGRRLTDDQITDIIELVVDDLDRLAVDPSVGSRRRGDDVDLTVGVTVDEDDEFAAMAAGVAVIKTALHAAGVGPGRSLTPRELRTRVLVLQAA